MRWEGRRESENIEDRRHLRPGPMVLGGGGLTTLIIIVAALLLGVNPQQFLANLPQQPGNDPAAEVQAPPEENEQTKQLKSFVSVVLADTEDVWNSLFPSQVGKPYQEPKLVLFADSVTSECGKASSAVGPFYCPADSNVYLDLTFFEEMRAKFKAPGDFAMAYVIAHEVGHHVQNLLGLSMKVQAMQRDVSKVEANNLSVRLELQADFLAGVWAHHAQRTKEILEKGDIEEAVNAAQQIGDDTLQRRMGGGRIQPDAFTHGSSSQRVRWFTRGLKSGKLEDLNLLFDTPYDQL